MSTPGLASIIIPCYQHAATLPEAISAALDQRNAEIEVVVIDDGSTDATADIMASFGSLIRGVRIEHAGASEARNKGIELANGEFLMFLDADDLIAPDKVAAQRAQFTDDIGWVLCDVAIVDAAKKQTTTASQRYDYAAKNLGGWIEPLLREANFIPIMSPLIRRSALGELRFVDRYVPEDWHFWHALARVARCRYLPRVLATYRKSRTGRSRTPTIARRVNPNIAHPLRLNLGCGTPGTRSWHPIPGFVNLDKSLGWRFEDGLVEFVTGSVAGISISHSLMYVPLGQWPAVFAEFARVLEPGGIVRITEDDATNPKSARIGGWKGSQPAVTLTDAAMVRKHLERAGFAVFDLTSSTTRYSDNSLMQAQHGMPPDVFFVEGVRQTCVLFSPHADDETLFASWTILRYRPRIIVCYQTPPDYGDTAARFAETNEAMQILGGNPVEQWDGVNIEAQMRELDARLQPTLVFAPSAQSSHHEHVAVARAAAAVFGDRLTTYHTYDEAGKVRAGYEVPFEPEWIEAKLRALARYTSQIRHPRAYQFFAWDLLEYAE